MKTSITELKVYMAFTMVMMMAPVIIMALRVSVGDEPRFDWYEVLQVWVAYIPFAIALVLHNFFLAPLLVFRNKRTLYAVLCVVLILVFSVTMFIIRPDKPLPPEVTGRAQPGRSLVMGQQDVVSVVVFILLMGMNVSTKQYFRSLHYKKNLDELRRMTLQRQVEMLNYQISPHFLMNTLNNIHALVDLDPEKAKTTILELSEIMRYLLYEADRGWVSLERDLVLLRNYIDLMRLRVTDKVKIVVDLPERVPHVIGPPLIFTTFVENAFKHGVSYDYPSFIRIALHVDMHKLCFTCDNSISPDKRVKKTAGGMGLKNVRERLQLIFPDCHELIITKSDNEYHVSLTVHFIDTKN